MRLAWSAVDELGRVFERPAEPNNVHFEVQVPGSLDPGLLQDSVGRVLAANPWLRARRRSAGLTRRSVWEIGDRADRDPLDVRVGGITAEREHLFAEHVDLGSSPLLRLRLVKTPGRDALMLSAHHALFDGISCLRIMRSLAAAYRGGPDPVPAVDPLTVRSGYAGRRNGAGSTRPPTRPAGPIAHLVRQTDGGGDGYGFALHALSRGSTEALNEVRHYGGAVNDLLLVGLFRAAAAWNSAHGTAAERLAITMPLNARPGRYREEFLGNLSRIVSVTADGDACSDPLELLAAVVRQTNAAKRSPNGNPAGRIGTVFGAGAVPYPLRRALLTAVRPVTGWLTDTTCLSNIVRVRPAFDFGPAGVADALWASPPAPMPRGLAVGAATYDGRLHLTVRYRRALLDAAAAQDFTATLVRQVHELAGVVSAAVGAAP